MAHHRLATIALLPLAAIAAGVACASSSPSPACTGCGGGTTSTTTTTTTMPPEPPTCRGTPLPAGDVSAEADGRSITVQGEKVTLHVGVLDAGIIRLRYQEPGSALSTRPSYAVVAQSAAPPAPRFGSTADTVLICTDELLVEVNRKTCALRVTQADGAVIVEDPAEGAYLHLEATGERGLRRKAEGDEHFYGFGEKTGALDRRGRSLTFWNTDAYQSAFGGYPPDADPLYQSIPFFVGLRGHTAYGLFLDSTFRLSVDVAKQDPSAVTMLAQGGEIDQYLMAGPTMSTVLERYTRLTGRMPLPPRWSLGYHQSRWGYAPDSAVLQIAQELRSRHIPADGLWLDIQHMDGFRSFTWDPLTFPDPAGLMGQLDALGFKAVAIVDPGIKVDPGWDVYDTGLAKGYFLAQGGSPYVGKVWPGEAVFPDFSAPEVRAFWGSLVPRTLGPGVSGLWIDMNEPSNFTGEPGGTVPDSLVAQGDGVAGTMAELHNVYALGEARATFEGMKAAAPDKRPFILTRAGYAGIQRYAAVWTGDAPSSWGTLQTTLPMLLGMGLSGLPFVGSDVGGYSGGPSPELFARWMQLGAFSPFFRDHVATGTPDQEPWQLGFEVEDISRNAIGARYELLPYLYSLFHEAASTGAPILRPLVYEFQDDEATHTLSDEAMLGPFLLEAPVISEGASTRTVYLPPGRWFEYSSGAAFEGGQSIETKLTLAASPTYVREGAIVPRAPLSIWTGEKPKANLLLDLYPAEQASSFTLYEDDGQSLAHEQGASSEIVYGLQRGEAGATLTASARKGSYLPPSRALIVRVRRVDHGVTAVRLDGKALSPAASYEALTGGASGYWYDERDLSLVVAFPDRDGFTLAMDYDPALVAPSPPVLMSFVVKLPPGTPQGTPVHIATSSSGWVQQPLSWGPGADSASGLVSVPRGQWVEYKYTRGGWSTVEKYPGCVEAKNRYALGAAHPDKQDTVWAWADLCP
jgi:alpha-glucosidase